ncbi:MAG: CoA pyrophosphatase [Clostridium sp.]|jgi:8-oxo-dGTP pyrophosphatase MutT (NUDIX family)|uniref:NUDIX hydrolase n=1 Tax=Clostridium sp. TaxID=1506 RepID=UPI0025C71BE8|nr:CoA pyrophosphatase [Clostridium sp.]MCH3963942.1 CoA pyrophosphatase [Clostridium sp.]MCI1716143.1 CoA pyrophosphatase [Clostridium sp.]MCI1800617.1 CoA pyrophosphatase [Clostridium sp.]MCI1814320.1 CoA pyrophosphatase [Clostridium sp.]MCI1871219.1 CoA pyrophosphatase [Clostridium sp.]
MDNIYNIFKNRKPTIIGNFNRASVMLLLTESNCDPQVIFEVRSMNLSHQPGDICLPGGKIEKDEFPKDAAIRETMEELNLNREDIDFIGDMDYVVTPFNFMMFPFVSRLKGDYNIVPNKSEVDHVFKVPLKFFIDTRPDAYELPLVQELDEKFPYHLINDGKNYKFRKGSVRDYFYRYEDYVIWGFTALVLKRFADIVKCGGKL